MDNLAIITDNQVTETPKEIQFRHTVQELCEAGSSVILMTRADLSHATDLVKIIKTRSKEIEEERTRLVKPFNEGVKAINSRFKAMTAPLDEAETEVKNKMLAFQREEKKRADEEVAKQEKIRQEALARAQKQAEEEAENSPQDRPIGPPPMSEIPVSVVSQHRPTTYGQTGAVSTVKKQWTFDLLNIQALAAARPDLVVVDTVKINQEIRGRGGVIPGLNVYEKDVISVR